MKKFQLIVSSIAAVLAIIGAVSTYFGLPFSSLLLFSKHTVTDISTDPTFSIEAISTDGSRAINLGESFSYKFDIPLSARGGTKLPDTESVWVVLKDESGGFYLQYPPVSIRSLHWTATKISPGNGIKEIIFFRVDSEGAEFFRSKVAHNEWGRFDTMPSSASELAFVELR